MQRRRHRPRHPTDQVRPITLRGTLRQAPGGALVLEASNGRWELWGEILSGLVPGTEIEVTGRPAPEVEGATGGPVIRVRRAETV
jgi:hypothetical protein